MNAWKINYSITKIQEKERKRGHYKITIIYGRTQRSAGGCTCLPVSVCVGPTGERVANSILFFHSPGLLLVLNSSFFFFGFLSLPSEDLLVCTSCLCCEMDAK